MKNYRLCGFKEGDRPLAERYAVYRTEHPFIGRPYGWGKSFRLVASYRDGTLRGWRVYAGSGAERKLLEWVDTRANKVVFYFREWPEDITRLSYLIGDYNEQRRMSV